jgi:hypothetical protein
MRTVIGGNSLGLHHTGLLGCVQPLLALPTMADPREIPQLTTELIDMSREYLRQETLEPAKRLGRNAGMGLGGALVLGLGAFFLVLALYNALKMWLPSGAWWVVLAKFLTALAAAGGAGLVAWRLQERDDY